jgi:hypothetical protein
MSHAMHIVPFWPHCMVFVFVMHTLPAQHPVHELASQTHWPIEQCCPAAHAAFMPHMHVPLAQVSALRCVQSAQLVAIFPHWVVLVGVTHEPFAQQPLGQLDGVQPEHMPASRQLWPLGHDWQVIPLLPHAAPAFPGWHWVPSALQHPAQLFGSHTQLPLEHL